METYKVSFGADYRRQVHPVLGFKPELADGVLTVEAENGYAAKLRVFELIGKQWCALYGPDSPPGWDAPDLGPLEEAVKNPGPKSWTVGVQFTVNGDGTFELHLDDLEVDLGRDGAPADLLRDVGHTLHRNQIQPVAFPTTAGKHRKRCLCGAPVEVWYEPGADEDNVPRSECLNRSCELSST
jgi:hypothetical protein